MTFEYKTVKNPLIGLLLSWGRYIDNEQYYELQCLQDSLSKLTSKQKDFVISKLKDLKISFQICEGCECFDEDDRAKFKEYIINIDCVLGFLSRC